MEENYNKGSKWIKCDLHVHTPFSIEHHYGDGQQEDVWEKYITDLESLPKEFKIIGINDYIFIDGYKKVIEYKKNGRLSNIDLILPVIELRIDKFGSINKDNPFKRVNYHIIFSDKLDPETIQQQFLNSLSAAYKLFPDYESNSSDWNGVITRDNLISLGERLKASSDGALKGSALKIGFQSLNIPYSQLIDKLDNIHLKGKFLKAVGKTEWEAMRWDGSPAEKKSVINAADFVFTASADKTAFDKSKASLKLQAVNDLLLDCSDAHSFSSETDTKDRIGNCNTWVKINPTFEGLTYLLYEPESRLFIGPEPELHTRVRNNQTKYIQKLTIKQIADYNEANGVWFKNQEVYPSSELTAIIGNKGKGKSAITDIIGLLGNSHNYDYFSFLSKKKFLKGGLAKNFEAELTWASGLTVSENLNSSIDYDLEEKVKYLPQSYFEDLCNEIENNENFKKEINQVVFTHLDITERNNASTFDEFIDVKKQTAEEKIASLRQELRILNEEIVGLQLKNTEEHKKGIQSKIDTIQLEIDSLIKNKPKNPFPDDPNKKDDDSETKGENFKLLEKANNDLDLLNIQQEKLTEELTNLNSDLTRLFQIKDRFETEKFRIQNFRSEESEELKSFDISIDEVYPEPKINLEPITKIIDKKEQQKITLELQTGKLSFDEDRHKDLSVNKSDLLIEKIKISTFQIEELSKTLDAKEKAIEFYKSSVTNWEKSLAEKKGNVLNPSSGSWNYFKNQLKFINEQLSDQIEIKKTERNDITTKIYKSKKSIVDIYAQFKSNIDHKLSTEMQEIKEYDISLEASMQVSNFSDNFLEFIDKGRTGSFKGQIESELLVKELLDHTNPNELEGVLKFLDEISQKLEFSGEDKQNPFNQIKESKNLNELYDFLYSLKYLDEKYELKFSGKSIEQLSPGERGAALIVFYLLLDNDEKPLIIDQPEDNLDNQSVFEVLVPFIRQAKKKRQLIIVTHNPNLAVVADAEQVIHVELDKKGNNVFSFKSGGIEKNIINNGIVDILEGTKPAFDKRKLKYLSDSYTRQIK